MHSIADSSLFPTSMYYTQIFSPKKKWFFWKKKFFPKKNKKNLPFFYATFQCGRYNVFKNFFFFFLPTKSWKNLPQKLLIIGPNLLFHSPAQPTANSPKSIFHIIKMSHQASVLLSVEKGLRHPLLYILCGKKVFS